MPFYKVTDKEIIKQINQGIQQKTQRINEMLDFAKRLGFDWVAYSDTKTLGIWLSGFGTNDPEQVDSTKYKRFVKKDVRTQFIPKKSNRKFYATIKEEYEKLTAVCFDYEPILKPIGGANWHSINDVYYDDDTLVFDCDSEVDVTCSQEIITAEYNTLVEQIKINNAK